MGGALVGGAVAALLGAGAWALILKFTEYELGIVAWGVGALVGLVMSHMTQARSPTLGVYAAILAALGLATGKVAILTIASPEIAQEMVADPDALTQAFMIDMKNREAFSTEINQQLATIDQAKDTLPDDLFELMRTEAAERMEAASPEERERVARSAWRSIVGNISLTQQFLATLSLFDLLWFFLAIGTAWKMMSG